MTGACTSCAAPLPLPVQIANHYLRANGPELAALLAGYVDNPTSISNSRIQLLAQWGHRIHLVMVDAVLKASVRRRGGDVDECTKHVLDCV